ncbi:MAG: TetR/AcrR family transcriptional regulator [Saprospiraceae bacterium]
MYHLFFFRLLEQMTTAEKIRDKACELFNEKGIAEVSIRDIAAALDISHGNLRYHYPGKGLIIEAIFQACLEASDKVMEQLDHPAVELSTILMATAQQAVKFWEFRFLLKDLLAITQQYPKVGDALRQMYRHREQQLNNIFQYLHHKGLLQEEVFPGYYKMVIENCLMATDFGISFVELNYPNVPETEKIHRYHLSWFVPMLACLTEKGQNEIFPLLQDWRGGSSNVFFMSASK